VAKELTAHLKKHNLLETFPLGFMRCHSTETTNLRIANDIVATNDGDKDTALVLLYLSAAFDTIDHEILLACLETDIHSGELKTLHPSILRVQRCQSTN